MEKRTLNWYDMLCGYVLTTRACFFLCHLSFVQENVAGKLEYLPTPVQGRMYLVVWADFPEQVVSYDASGISRRFSGFKLLMHIIRYLEGNKSDQTESCIRQIFVDIVRILAKDTDSLQHRLEMFLFEASDDLLLACQVIGHLHEMFDSNGTPVEVLIKYVCGFVGHVLQSATFDAVSFNELMKKLLTWIRMWDSSSIARLGDIILKRLTTAFQNDDENTTVALSHTYCMLLVLKLVCL